MRSSKYALHESDNALQQLSEWSVGLEGCLQTNLCPMRSEHALVCFLFLVSWWSLLCLYSILYLTLVFILSFSFFFFLFLTLFSFFHLVSILFLTLFSLFHYFVSLLLCVLLVGLRIRWMASLRSAPSTAKSLTTSYCRNNSLKLFVDLPGTINRLLPGPTNGLVSVHFITIICWINVINDLFIYSFIYLEIFIVYSINHFLAYT
jgi:hypothetical protein